MGSETNKDAGLEWGYHHGDWCQAKGPYPTREAALASAARYVKNKSGKPLEFTVGKCMYASVGVGLQLDDVVERMNDMAHDNGFSVDGDFTFELKGDKDAEREAEEELMAWAEKHIAVSRAWLLVDIETVTVY